MICLPQLRRLCTQPLLRRQPSLHKRRRLWLQALQAARQAFVASRPHRQQQWCLRPAPHQASRPPPTTFSRSRSAVTGRLPPHAAAEPRQTLRFSRILWSPLFLQYRPRPSKQPRPLLLLTRSLLRLWHLLRSPSSHRARHSATPRPSKQRAVSRLPPLSPRLSVHPPS
jgi:hypothetical protein